MTASDPASGRAAIGQNLPAAIEAWISGIAASRRLSLLTIALLALIVFLPGFASLGALDRDEPYFATVARAIAESGGMSAAGRIGLVPPTAVLWLQALSADLFGSPSIIAYRVPSLLAALGAVLATWWMAMAFARPRAALFAGGILAVTPLLAAEAHLAKADALLLVAIVLAQGVLARLWLRKRSTPNYKLAALFWVAVVVGICARAPAAVAAIGLTALTLSAFSRSLDWLRGLAPVAGLSVAFLVLMAVGALLLVGGDATGLLEGVMTQDDYHAPPGTYAVLFYPLFGPAGVFLALLLPSVLERVRRPVFAFGIATVVPYWLLTELLPMKLPPYILPAYPALALLAATAIDDGKLRMTGWISTYFALNLWVWPVVVGIGATVLFIYAEKSLPVGAIPFFIAAIVAGAFSFRWLYRGTSLVGAAVLALVSTALVYIGLFGAVFAGLDGLRVAERVVAEVRQVAPCDKPLMVVAGFPEPSLVFEAGPELRVVTPAEAADFLAEGVCRVALIESRRQAIFNQRTADLGLDVVVRGTVGGFNLGNWRPVNMRIFTRTASGQ